MIPLFRRTFLGFIAVYFGCMLMGLFIEWALSGGGHIDSQSAMFNGFAALGGAIWRRIDNLEKEVR